MNKITKNTKKNVRGIAFDEISFQFYSKNSLFIMHNEISLAKRGISRFRGLGGGKYEYRKSKTMAVQKC